MLWLPWLHQKATVTSEFAAISYHTNLKNVCCGQTLSHDHTYTALCYFGVWAREISDSFPDYFANTSTLALFGDFLSEIFPILHTDKFHCDLHFYVSLHYFGWIIGSQRSQKWEPNVCPLPSYPFEFEVRTIVAYTDTSLWTLCFK